MKKLIALFVITFHFCLAGCGNDGSQASIVSSDPNRLVLNVPLSGTFTTDLPTDIHNRPHLEYTFNATLSGRYQFDLISSNTTAYDPYIRILRGTTEIAHNDDGAGALNSRITTDLRPGLYTIRVTKFGTGQIQEPTEFTLTADRLATTTTTTTSRRRTKSQTKSRSSSKRGKRR